MYQQMEVVERLCSVPHSAGSDPQTPLYTDMSDQNSGQCCLNVGPAPETLCQQ